MEIASPFILSAKKTNGFRKIFERFCPIKIKNQGLPHILFLLTWFGKLLSWLNSEAIETKYRAEILPQHVSGKGNLVLSLPGTSHHSSYCLKKLVDIILCEKTDSEKVNHEMMV